MANVRRPGNRSIDVMVGVRSNSQATAIDPSAPAGSEDSLGAESVRDGRPSTDSDIVEAIDEEEPGETDPLTDDRG